ncbi:MAG: 1-deoxy-D-xylulose-5-phosphate synthase [Phycisphaeraceae bacterium]|nr:1-deoxy-D-xylulose-5-phosphate synthase [Phycisphaerales bacterium]MCB9861332.1 1-deoxy-D-xylulose-5-phosphate synthase [Phycisphaeraceae bacterium]
MGLLETINSPADLRKLSVEQLPQVAQEIREKIIAQVSKSGGHLAPNLGVVELTIALHYVFDFGHDRLLFDVGHQCYPHKLLTGRQHLLKDLRTRKGMSGFPAPSESPYDLFSVGHAGTAISTAVGIARGDSLAGQAYDAKDNPDGRRVVSLIGDASIVNGVAMEGLNNAGTLKRQFLVVLNDNSMSISKPQGAVSQYFDRLRISPTYADFKKGARSVLKHVPGGSLLREAYHQVGEMTKAIIAEDAWFERFGLVTAGPIDGHNIQQLIGFLSEARDLERPMVLWVKTTKGKGLDVAENDATKFHSPAAFKLEGNTATMKSSGRSFTAAFGDALVDLMQRDESVVACTAAMPDGTGVVKAIETFPTRTWDTGICESHAMDMMAGLAFAGYKPFFAVYSTFLQRAFDQAFQESSLQSLPVRLCLDRAGLVGGDGAVHHGFCDIALLRTLPASCLMAAIDEPSLKASLAFMAGYDEGLSAVRYPRDNVSGMFASESCPAFEIGRARLLTSDVDPSDASHNVDVVVLAYGTCAIDAMHAAHTLATHQVAVYDARFAKPVDVELIRTLVERQTPIVTIEDHSVVGGFGAAVTDAVQEIVNTSEKPAPRVLRLGLPDRWVHQNSRNEQLAEVGLDAGGIASSIAHFLAEHHDAPASGSQAKIEPKLIPAQHTQDQKLR